MDEPGLATHGKKTCGETNESTKRGTASCENQEGESHFEMGTKNVKYATQLAVESKWR